MVHIEAIGEDALDQAAIESFTAELQSYSGAVTSSGATWNATITVEAPTPVEAATVGDVVIRGAAITTRLSEWQTTRLEVRTYEDFERELGIRRDPRRAT
jgi:hypothetical protein